MQVPHEPTWASPCCRIAVPQWLGLLAAAEKLIERVAALDSFLEEQYQVWLYTFLPRTALASHHCCL